MKDLAHSRNHKFDADLQHVLAWIYYYAWAGFYALEFSTVGWKKDDRVEYVLVKLEEEYGFCCYQTTNNSIRIEWSI